MANKMQKRVVLWWMFLFLTIIHALVQINLTIAIVSMVNYSRPTNDNETFSTKAVCPNTTFPWGTEYTSTKNVKNITLQPDKEERYNWTEKEQNDVLSSYYWLSLFAILPAGVLSQKFGSKIMLGTAQALASLMSSLIPMLAFTGPQTVMYIRMLQGFFSLVAVPGSLLTITGNWVPPEDRGRFISVLLFGSTLGLGFGNIVFGYMAQKAHWQYVFHATSLAGLVWTVLWYWLIHDSPTKHPTISTQEKNYIMNSLKCSEEKEKIPIPWRNILTSFPFIVNAIANGAMAWHVVILSTYVPKYLKAMYDLNSNQIGFVSSLPQFASGIAAYLFGFISDVIVKKKLLSVTHSRKSFAFFGGIVSALPLIIVAFTNCNIMVVIACFIFATAARNLNFFGIELALIDMSPRFCGVLQGFAGTVAALLTAVLAKFISYVSSQKADVDEVWKTIFLTAGILCILLSGLFIVFGTAEMQPWNSGCTRRIKKNQVGLISEKEILE